MRVAVTGATGLIGPLVVEALRARGDERTVLSRDAEPERERLEAPVSASSDGPRGALQAIQWDLLNEPTPIAALVGRDAIVHLAGENVAQRWSASTKQAIVD